MRAFITFCLLASAYAKPQGYNYQSQQSSFQNQQQNSFHANSVSSNSIAAAAPSFLQEALQNSKLSHSLISAPPSTNYLPPLAGPALPPLPTHQQGFQPSVGPQQPNFNSYAPQQQQQYPQQYQSGGYAQSPSLVTKDIYVHVAPEEREEQHYQRPVLPPPPPRKHYRIVFIKAPTPKVNTASVRVNHAPTEEKTIIYVLTRKPDPIDLQAAVQEVAPKQPSKPEVYFIKYRTQEEARHAQQTIQAQYDQLGGTTQISDEGVAPVTSVVGALDQQHGGGAGASIGHGGGHSEAISNSISSSSASSSSGSIGNSKYLPPIVRI